MVSINSSPVVYSASLAVKPDYTRGGPREGFHSVLYRIGRNNPDTPVSPTARLAVIMTEIPRYKLQIPTSFALPADDPRQLKKSPP